MVVKDAARGIAAGVAEVFPDAEQRDDCFHVLYEMNKVRRKLERRAYAAIEREGEALGRLGKIRARDKTCRRKAKCALRKARRQCTQGGFVLHGFLNPPNEITAGLDILPAL